MEVLGNMWKSSETIRTLRKILKECSKLSVHLLENFEKFLKIFGRPRKIFGNLEVVDFFSCGISRPLKFSKNPLMKHTTFV